jgi:hypothetical protein
MPKIEDSKSRWGLLCESEANSAADSFRGSCLLGTWSLPTVTLDRHEQLQQQYLLLLYFELIIVLGLPRRSRSRRHMAAGSAVLDEYKKSSVIQSQSLEVCLVKCSFL